MFPGRADFKNQSFLDDFEKVNWNHFFQLNRHNANMIFNNYLNTMNTLNSHIPLKKLKKQRKF